MCLGDIYIYIYIYIYISVTFASFTETIEKAVHVARFTFLSELWVAVQAESECNGQAYGHIQCRPL